MFSLHAYEYNKYYFRDGGGDGYGYGYDDDDNGDEEEEEEEENLMFSLHAYE